MLQAVLHNYAFQLNYAKMLAEGVPDEQMAVQPGGMKNHPAWTLGHLAYASDFAATLLGLESTVPATWVELFGRGSEPVADRSKYPAKNELLAGVEEQHRRVSDALAKADTGLLEKPTPNEQFRQIMPTVGDALVHLLISHEAAHLGQLSAWRRLMGMPSVMG